VHLIDVVPTLLELAGVTKPAAIRGHRVPPAPGRSLVPAFKADVNIDRDFLWWEHEGNRAIRAGDWKLVALKGGGWELYDLSRDRGEQRDLAATQPGKAGELAALWTRQMEQTAALALTDPPPPEASKKGKGAKARKTEEP
jgi:arylsulfatase